jgi:hypothetical protein
MGYICRHAIAVTGTYGEHIDQAHEYATATGASVTPIIEGVVNGERSFFVAPDGSKEYWLQSNQGDSQRHSIVEYLKSIAYEDGSSPLSWAEFTYGDDNGVPEIINHKS